MVIVWRIFGLLALLFIIGIACGSTEADSGSPSDGLLLSSGSPSEANSDEPPNSVNQQDGTQIRGPVGPSGPQGPRGVSGPTGPRGVSGPALHPEDFDFVAYLGQRFGQSGKFDELLLDLVTSKMFRHRSEEQAP